MPKPGCNDGRSRSKGTRINQKLTQDKPDEWLRAKMAEAEAQVRSGDVVEMTATFWDDLDREVDERPIRGDVPSPDVCP